jgi:Bacterial Ig-like domain
MCAPVPERCTSRGSPVAPVLDSGMLPRRRSLAARSWSGPALALCAWCLWGCPQLLSDDFLSGQAPLDLDDDDGTSGSAGSSGTEPQNVAGAGGAGNTPVAAPGPPAVVSVSPSNGASGVAADAIITVTFSEPMSTSSAQAAYTSSDLPASAVSFSWSAGNTVLRIAPLQPLTRATGSSAATTTAQRYAFEIGTTAVDLDGDALPRFSSSFSTLRELTQTLAAQQDRNLTGNWRSDNVYGDNSCQFADSTTTCIGDSSNANSSYRGFVSFDLSSLPTTLTELTAAQLGMSVDDNRFTPFPDLGNLVAEPVSFASISLDAFSSAALGPAISVSSSAAVGARLSADVRSAVQADLAARSRSQFRLRFSTDTDSDDTGDLVQVLSTTEQLTVSYLIP